MAELLYKDESFRIIGACFEVYKQKGCGFTEPVYQECLSIEFDIQEIPFVAQPSLQLEYKGRPLRQIFKPDFICYGKIIIELKSLERLCDTNRTQTLNYLSCSLYDLALLVNFGHFPKLAYERITNDRNRGTRPNIYSQLAQREAEKDVKGLDLASFRVFRGQNLSYA